MFLIKKISKFIKILTNQICKAVIKFFKKKEVFTLKIKFKWKINSIRFLKIH